MGKCRGHGEKHGNKCITCDGTGEVNKENFLAMLECPSASRAFKYTITGAPELKYGMVKAYSDSEFAKIKVGVTLSYTAAYISQKRKTDANFEAPVRDEIKVPLTRINLKF